MFEVFEAKSISIVTPELEFYMDQRYLSFEAETDEGFTYVHLKDKKNGIYFIFPFLKRIIPESGYYDLISPYGYAGYYSNSHDLDIHDEAFSCLQDFCKQNNIVSTFIRLNPFENSLNYIERDGVEQLIHGRVVTVPLSQEYEKLKEKYSSNHKRGIKKLMKLGFRVEKGTIETIDSFIEVYNQTMSRLNASDYYFFDKSYYEMLFDLNTVTQVYFVKNDKDEVVSGAVFCLTDDIIQYHLGGTAEGFVKMSPNKMIFDHLIHEYAEKKKWLNLGGGYGGSQDNLFNFKRGFSSFTHKFSTLRIVNMRDQYNNLSKDKSLTDDNKDFFPRYRINS